MSQVSTQKLNKDITIKANYRISIYKEHRYKPGQSNISKLKQGICKNNNTSSPNMAYLVILNID